MSDISSIVPAPLSIAGHVSGGGGANGSAGSNGAVAGNGSVGSASRINSFFKPASAIEVSPPNTPSAEFDRVELSDFARHLDALRQLPDVRLDRITRARQAIADGLYEDQAVLDQAIERLMEEDLL